MTERPELEPLTEGEIKQAIVAFMERELVRCGCGVVRSPDEDELLAILAPLALPERQGFDPVPALERFEAPRLCRRCGVVYMLPRPSAPKGERENAK